jgi:hypothetical protein
MSPINQSDLDLLADYVGGALDGTSEADQVSERIRSDIAWAAAYAELVAATDDVQARLRGLGGEPEPMPADVWSRLEATLLAEPPLSEPAAHSVVPAPVGPSRPVDNRPAGRPTGHRRRRWAPVLVGIVILAALGLGISALRPLVGAEEDSGSGTTAAAPDSATAAPAARVATGRDYTEKTLILATDFGNANTLSQQTPAAGGQDQEKSSSPAPFSSFAAPVPTELTRLLAPEALSRCLQGVGGVIPGDVVGVDYAKYAGSSALIVVVRAADGSRWVGVAGPDCGVNGPDLVLSRRVG